MGVLDVVVLGFRPARIARQASGLAQRVEGSGAAGEHLVHIGLMTGVPESGCRCGESNTRCNARVSSTTPRLGPRWPPVRHTESTNCSRMSVASSANSSAERPRRSAGPRISESAVTEPPHVLRASRASGRSTEPSVAQVVPSVEKATHRKHAARPVAADLGIKCRPDSPPETARAAGWLLRRGHRTVPSTFPGAGSRGRGSPQQGRCP